MISLLDLSIATCVANTDTQLVNRRDSAIDGPSAADGKARRLTGLLGTTANLGYVIGLIDGELVLSIDMAAHSAHTGVIPVDVPVPAGSELAFYAHATTGTAVCSVTIVHETD